MFDNSFGIREFDGELAAAIASEEQRQEDHVLDDEILRQHLVCNVRHGQQHDRVADEAAIGAGAAHRGERGCLVVEAAAEGGARAGGDGGGEGGGFALHVDKTLTGRVDEDVRRQHPEVCVAGRRPGGGRTSRRGGEGAREEEIPVGKVELCSSRVLKHD